MLTPLFLYCDYVNLYDCIYTVCPNKLLLRMLLYMSFYIF